MPFKTQEERREYARAHYLKNRDKYLLRTKNYRLLHPEKRADAQRRYRAKPGHKYIRIHQVYGVQREEFERLEQLHQSQCAICKQKKLLHVDHCHTSGKIRGLLCGKCNKALGQFGDSIEGLRAAVAYLENFDASRKDK